MEQQEVGKKLLLQERLTIPYSIWINSVGLIFVVAVFTIKRPHWALYIVLLLIVAAQIRLILHRHYTKYELTTEGLQVKYKDTLLLQVPYLAMRQIDFGKFRQLVTTEPVRKLNQATDIQALPKLGGVSKITLLLYQQEEKNKALLFQPSLTMRLFLEDRIKEQMEINAEI